jgi:hypothetical protein
MLLMAPVGLLAQEVIAGQGDFSSTPSGSLSWTFGEVVTETISTGSGTFTQGFQQVILSDATLTDLEGSSELEVYPNPFHTVISIVNRDLEGEYQVIILDNSGKVVYRSVLDTSDTADKSQLNLSHLASGIYHLQLTSENTSFLINRIVKY